MKYRDNGAVGAFLDEYEKAVNELIVLIGTVIQDELIAIVDPNTEDEDCRSIQTILAHVVRAGYTYAIQIRLSQGEDLPFRKTQVLDSVASYQQAISTMFDYNVDLFSQYPNLILEENNVEKKMLTNWGQRYDVEQLFEHAIVHVLRHRRQIERFLVKLRDTSKSKFNFHNKYFALVENSENGSVDRSTTFHYQQKDNLITAEYYGGTVRNGKIIAKLSGDRLDMRYQCLTTDNEFKVGKAIAEVSLNAENKIVLNLDWQWIGIPDVVLGKSSYIEV